MKRVLNLVPEKLDGVTYLTVNSCDLGQVRFIQILTSSFGLWAPLRQGLFYFSFVGFVSGAEYEISTCLTKVLNFLICKIG